MTVTDTTSKISYTGNGSTDDFDFPFPAQEETQIKAFVDGVELDQGSDPDEFSVSLEETSEGGTVTFNTAPDSDAEILIKRSMDLLQGVNIPVDGVFPEDQVEAGIDKSRMIEIDTREILSRALKFSETTTEDEDPTLEDLTGNAGKLATCNEDENGIEFFSGDEVLNGVENQFEDTGTALQAAADIEGFEIDASEKTSGFYILEITRAATQYTQLCSLTQVAGVWSFNYLVNSGDHGLIFTVSSSSGVGQVKAEDIANSAFTIKGKGVRLDA